MCERPADATRSPATPCPASRYSALLSAPTMSTRSSERLVIALMINVNSSDIAAAIAYVGSSTRVSKYSDGIRKMT